MRGLFTENNSQEFSGRFNCNPLIKAGYSPAMLVVIFVILACFGPGAGVFALEDHRNYRNIEMEPGDFEEIEEIDREELSEVTRQEREITQKLFNLSREIETIEEEREKIIHEKENIKQELKEAEKKRRDYEEDIERMQEDVAEVFRYLQKKGPLSYVEIILEAKGPADFLQRLTILRDVFSNIGDLFSSFVEGRKEVIALEEEIKKDLSHIEDLEERLKQNLASLESKRQEQRELLEEVRAEKEEFEAQMARIESIWIQETKPLLLDITEHLQGLIEEDKVERDIVNIGGSLLNPKVEVPQESFNYFFQKREELPKVLFDFKEEDEKVLLKIPAGEIVFTGKITPAGESRLNYEIEKARFFDIYLGDEVVDELTEDINIGFDFGPVMGNYRIEDLTVSEDGLLLDVRSTFFY